MRWARVAVLLIAVLLPRLGPAAESETGAADRPKLGEFVPSSAPGPAPALTLSELDGGTVELADLKGKPVLVNLWATWCEPCLREMPSLERLQSRFGDQLTIVAVSEDRGGDKLVAPFIAKLGLKLVKIYLDPKSAVGHAFAVRGLPTSILIDRDGNVRGRVEGGAEWDSPKILAVIEPLIAGQAVVKASSR